MNPLGFLSYFIDSKFGVGEAHNPEMLTGADKNKPPHQAYILLLKDLSKRES